MDKQKHYKERIAELIERISDLEKLKLIYFFVKNLIK